MLKNTYKYIYYFISLYDNITCYESEEKIEWTQLNKW